MSARFNEAQNRNWPRNEYAVIEVTVRNHPGVLSHICNLFSRRAYDVEGILCLPVGRGRQNRIWVLVNAEQPLEQMIKQVEKLEDVCGVRSRVADRDGFLRLEGFLASDPAA
ncbi:MAG: ACT domain-containing protein [Desulfomonile tiedjei]|nr:ACT domain-containing protein [Desulfomonile tiedjei]